MAAELVGQLRVLDDEIKAQNEQGIVPTISYAGKPFYKVESLEPFVYKRFGLLRNRAPQLAGPVAIRATLVVQSEFDMDTQHIQPGIVFDMLDQTPNELYAATLTSAEYHVLGQTVLGPERYNSLINTAPPAQC